MHFYNDPKLKIALKKASSTLEKVRKMVDDNQYCIDIIQQSLAVTGLLNSFNQSLLEQHLKHCFKSAMQSEDQEQQNKMVEELIKIMKSSRK